MMEAAILISPQMNQSHFFSCQIDVLQRKKKKLSFDVILILCSLILCLQAMLVWAVNCGVLQRVIWHLRHPWFGSSELL